MSARHRGPARVRALWAGAAVFVAAALLAGGSMAAGAALAEPAAPVRTEATAARPTATVTPSADPTEAARSLRAVRDLREGDSLLYHPEPYGRGEPCTFVAFESPSPTWARVDCGSGQVNVKVCDVASTTAYAIPGKA